MRTVLLACAVVLACACGDDDDDDDGGGPGGGATGSDVDIAVTALDFSNGTARVSFTVHDADGRPLDVAGERTDGEIAVSFVLAQLAVNPDGSPAQYTAYTTRTVEKRYPTPDSSITAIQATNEPVTDGKLEDQGDGRYRYTFKASTRDRDPALTQSVLAVAVREIGETEHIDRDLFSTGGGAAREQVTDQTCNSCHGSFAEHGGRYTSTSQCVLCHTPQTTDPDSGNTVDFRVMIHKIHAGEHLPSHVAEPRNEYRIIGFMGSVHSYATVAMPGPSEEGTNHARCETCHGGAQADVWKTRPSVAACTSCHDTTVFTPEQNPPFTVAHEGGTDPALVNESTCVVCHAPTAGISPVTQVHYRGVFAADFPTVEATIDGVTNTGPGALPTITFRIRVNGAPRNLIAEPLTTLTANLAGPTTDIASYWQARIQGTGAVGTLTPVDAANGVFTYTFPATGCTDALTPNRPCAIPADATGSYQASLEGYIQPTPANPRATLFSPVAAFAVTDAVPTPRRMIVSEQTCNGCHLDLRAHGGSRKNPNACVFCHNPNKANDTRAPKVEGEEVFAPSVDFRVMIHKIHMGEELSEPYLLYGFPAPNAMNPRGTSLNFGETRYPRARTDCEACHVGMNWTLPMNNSPAYLPSVQLEMVCNEAPDADPDMFCQAPNFVAARQIVLQPQTSVCTSCHDAPQTFAHALVNTTPQGAEACATCHGVGKTWDVATFHGFR